MIDYLDEKKKIVDSARIRSKTTKGSNKVETPRKLRAVVLLLLDIAPAHTTKLYLLSPAINYDDLCKC